MLTSTLLSPYGLDGTIKANFFSSKIDHLHIGDVLNVHLRNGNKVSLVLDGIREAKHEKLSAYLHFQGYDTKEKAKELSNAKIFVKRENAAPLCEDEVYTADLQDMDVLLDEKKVGRVISIIDMSNGVLLEVERLDKKRFLVPYKDVFIGKVDVINNFLELKIKELLEL